MPRGMAAILQPQDPAVWTGIPLGAAMAQLCVRIPSAVWFFSCMKRLKSHVTSSSPNARVLVKVLFISLKAFFCSGPHSRGSLPDPAVASNNGLAISEKPRIYIWQNPTALRNSQTSFLVLGQGIEQMACFLSCLSTRCPYKMTNPRYLTFCLQIWAFSHDTLYPEVESGASRALVLFQQSPWVRLAINRSSTYWSKMQFKVSPGKAARSTARA